MLIKLSVSESFADTFNLEITCLILLSHSPNIGPHCLTWLACLVWYTHKTPAQPRDSGRWLNQRIIRSTIFKPPQDWQIIIYTSTTKIFWEISAVSSLDCGQLRVAGLGWAKRRSRENRDIFISVWWGKYQQIWEKYSFILSRVATPIIKINSNS